MSAIPASSPTPRPSVRQPNPGPRTPRQEDKKSPLVPTNPSVTSIDPRIIQVLSSAQATVEAREHRRKLLLTMDPNHPALPALKSQIATDTKEVETQSKNTVTVIKSYFEEQTKQRESDNKRAIENNKDNNDTKLKEAQIKSDQIINKDNLDSAERIKAATLASEAKTKADAKVTAKVASLEATRKMHLSKFNQLVRNSAIDKNEYSDFKQTSRIHPTRREPVSAPDQKESTFVGKLTWTANKKNWGGETTHYIDISNDKIPYANQGWCTIS